MFAHCDLGEKDGYAGIGLYSKKEPIKVTYGIGNKEFDSEGRVITAEYENFYLVAVCKYLLNFYLLILKGTALIAGVHKSQCQVAVIEFLMLVPRCSSSIRAADLPEILRNVKLIT